MESTFSNLSQTTMGLHTTAATVNSIATISQIFSSRLSDRDVNPTGFHVRSPRMNIAIQQTPTITADTTASKKNETIRFEKGLIVP